VQPPDTVKPQDLLFFNPERVELLSDLWDHLNMADEIITELWQIKDEMAREAGYDLDTYLAAVHARIKELGVKTVNNLGDIESPGPAIPNDPKSSGRDPD
jgi:hypothetical protein